MPCSVFDRIAHNPNSREGKACMRKMRIPMSLIVNLVTNGMTVEETMDEYPVWTREMSGKPRAARPGQSRIQCTYPRALPHEVPGRNGLG